MPDSKKKYNLCLDIGTTNIRCAICDPEDKNKIVTIVYEKLDTLYLDNGRVEINPQHLWTQIVSLIKKCLASSSIPIEQISALGISAQRNTFVTWDRTSGEEFHNLIVWKDLRANDLVETYNKSWMLWGLNVGSKLLYYVTAQTRFLAGSVLKFMNGQVTLRLLWVLSNNPDVKKNLLDNNVLFGTLDTWLIYKLTQGSRHVTDVSHASCSGLYDPFTLSWADWALKMFRLPRFILPEVVGSRCTDGEFGVVHASVLGREIPIICSMADQSAAMFGLSCYREGDIKVTLGTGSFMDVNTRNKPHASIAGLYPLVGWRSSPQSSSLVYLVEGSTYDTGTLIEWGRTIGLYRDVEETSDLASSVDSSEGVVFCPAFSGLQAPINDPTATAGFLGVSPKTRREHLVRALLESVAFRVQQMYETVLSETRYHFSCIKVDGGTSRNNFLCQLIADLTQLRVLRPSQAESSILGIANMISNGERGQNHGWSQGKGLRSNLTKRSRGGREEKGDGDGKDGRGEKALGTGDEGYVEDINEDEDVTEFTPRPDEYDKIMPVFKKWETELRRFQHWT